MGVEETGSDETDSEEEAVLDAICDNPRLMALLREAACSRDLTAVRAAVADLDVIECDGINPAVLMAELLVRLLLTYPSPAHDRGRNADLIVRLRELGLCDAGHFDGTLILSALEQGLQNGYLIADVYDTAQQYIASQEPGWSEYLDGIERLPVKQ